MTKQKMPYVNREVSWLRFNRRVLAEAENRDNPLLERTKFISIMSTNLDEFFMVRVGSLMRELSGDAKKRDPSGMSAQKQLQKIEALYQKQLKKQYEILNDDLLPALEREGLYLLKPGTLTAPQQKWLSAYFDTHIKPVLTPRAIDQTRPFPLLSGRSIYLAVLLPGMKENETRFALVPVPGGLPRVIMLPMGHGSARGILLEEVITMYVHRLFDESRPLCCQPFRITRNADFIYDDHDADNLIAEMRKNLKKRRFGRVVRVELPQMFDPRLSALLKRHIAPKGTIVARVRGPIHPDFFMKQLSGLEGFDRLRFAGFAPYTDERLLARESIFRTIRGGDLFFHHPYDSFDPIERFVSEAASDPNVLAIKQTLYRVSGKSPIVASLARAAQNGKQVTALIEVRARFDEENNINWCMELEKTGCHVIYGVPKLKTHSKITLVVRREEHGLRRYVHLGTGNYNDVTARLYTDMGILTCDEDIGQDASDFFNNVTGLTAAKPMRALVSAPEQLKPALIALIRRETDNARQGLPASILAKMNALTEPSLIAALYEAADAGVEIDLIVRGICCAKAREHLRVRSIVGRLLEHARAFIFENGGEPETYLSSADWMQRNLDKRVELMFPVRNADIARRIRDILLLEQRDNRKAWALLPSGKYRRVPRGEESVNSQEVLIAEASAHTASDGASAAPKEDDAPEAP